MKRHLSLLLPAGAALLLVLLASYVQGVWTQRWDSTAPQRLQQFAAVFDSGAIPLEIGDWQGEDLEAEDPETEELELQVAGAVRHMSRVYRHVGRGDEVHVFMICGMSRSVAKHTPDACYPGAGFRPVGDIQSFTMAEADDSQFDTAVFAKEAPKGREVRRVFWAWNAKGHWEAPAHPRFKYRGATPLLKMYLTSVPKREGLPSDSVCNDFAKVFIPEINRQFFPPGAADDATADAAGG